MRAGFEAYGDADGGRILLSDRYPTMRFITKYDLTLTRPDTNTGFYTVLFPNPAYIANPKAFSGGYVVAVHPLESTYFLWAPAPMGAGPLSIAITMYIFGTPTDQSSGLGFGAQTFDESGELTFDLHNLSPSFVALAQAAVNRLAVFADAVWTLPTGLGPGQWAVWLLDPFVAYNAGNIQGSPICMQRPLGAAVDGNGTVVITGVPTGFQFMGVPELAMPNSNDTATVTAAVFDVSKLF